MNNDQLSKAIMNNREKKGETRGKKEGGGGLNPNIDEAKMKESQNEPK